VQTLPITIYLADESIHEQVEAAVERLVERAGLDIFHRDDPVIGSWFRRMFAAAKALVRTAACRVPNLVAWPDLVVS